MAARLIVLYDQPEDPAAFDAHYRDVHAPIVRRYPSVRELRLIKTTWVGRTPGPYLMAEMLFDSRSDLDAALMSEAGVESGRDLRNFAGAGFSIVIADDDATFDG